MRFFYLFLAIFLVHSTAAQVPGDSTTLVILAPTQRNNLKKLPDGTDLTILAGTVKVQQGTALFYCDSCVINNKTGVFEAFGRVHINDSDTAHIYSNYLKYFSATRLANLRGNVRLTDGKGTLTTQTLDYDVSTRTGMYYGGGKVVSGKSVVTSREGTYYADLRDVYFKKDVVVKDPAYTLRADSMLYNTGNSIARFIAETLVRDSSGRTIRSREGYYDLKNRKAEFTARTRVVDKSLIIEGDNIASDDATGLTQILGNGVLIDTAEGYNILADEIFADRNKGAYLATRKPLMIIEQKGDSIFIAADTLFSARLSDRFVKVDTTKKTATKVTVKTKPIKGGSSKKMASDSTNRYFEAFRNVRIFSDSAQAVGDSVFFSFRDSVFRIFQDPVVWTGKHQIIGDTIYMHTKNKKADKMLVFENALLISENEPGIYQQLASRRMDALFTAGVIDSVRAAGEAKSIYFMQDDDSAYTGINETASDIMDVYFDSGALRRIVWRSAVKGTLWPPAQKSPSSMRLPGFEWLNHRRPKSKYELY